MEIEKVMVLLLPEMEAMVDLELVGRGEVVVDPVVPHHQWAIADTADLQAEELVRVLAAESANHQIGVRNTPTL